MILYSDEVTHEDFAEMKKEFGFSHQDIADITGLALGTVKNQTRPSVKLATWAKQWPTFFEEDFIHIILFLTLCGFLTSRINY